MGPCNAECATRDHHAASLLSKRDHLSTRLTPLEQNSTGTSPCRVSPSRGRLNLSGQTSAPRADELMPASPRVLDGVAGVPAPSGHVTHGFNEWRWQASPSDQERGPHRSDDVFYFSKMAAAFPLTGSTDAQAAPTVGEAVLACLGRSLRSEGQIPAQRESVPAGF